MAVIACLLNNNELLPTSIKIYLFQTVRSYDITKTISYDIIKTSNAFYTKVSRLKGDHSNKVTQYVIARNEILFYFYFSTFLFKITPCNVMNVERDKMNSCLRTEI